MRENREFAFTQVEDHMIADGMRRICPARDVIGKVIDGRDDGR
jgi:hypothetical protein